MAKYCTKCGKMLADGEICNCVQETEQMTGQYAEQAVTLAKGVFGIALDVIKNPLTAGKKLVEEANIKTALILIVVHAIINSLFVMLAENKVLNFIISLIKLDGDITEKQREHLAEPYFRIFLTTLFLSVGLSLALAAMMMLGYRIVKANVSYEKMVSLAAIRSTMIVPGIIVSAIILEISWKWGVVAFLIVSIIGLVCFVLTANMLNETDKKDKMALIMSGIIILFIIVKIFAVSKISTMYLPDDMKDAVEEIQDSDELNLIKEIF